MGRLAVIIANPAARGASVAGLREAERVLSGGGLEVRTLLTARRGDAEAMARDVSRKGPKLVLAAGGDGTYNEVANGLAGTGVPMGVLPVGHMNVLARELGIPLDAVGASLAALRGRPRPVTLGRVAFGEEARYFFLMAGIGFDAMAVESINRSLKKLAGKTAYIINGLKVLLSWDPVELPVTLDGERMSAYSLIVCNTARYAGDLKVAPDASITDPGLYAFLMHGRKRSDVIRYSYGIIAGRHLGFGDITYRRAERIVVEGASEMQLDGDRVGRTPAVITAVPEAISLVY